MNFNVVIFIRSYNRGFMLSQNEPLRLGSLFFVALVVSLSVHEFFHALVALFCGDSMAKERGRLTLNPLAHLDPFGTVMLAILAFQGMGIGWAKPVPVDTYALRKNRMIGLVALAGPLSNLLMALLAFQVLILVQAFLFSNFSVPFVIEALIVDFLNVFIRVNIALSAFNLLPIYPLDGAKVLSSLLPAEWSRMVDSFFIKHGARPLLLFVLWEWFLPIPGPISFILGPFMQFFIRILEYSSFYL